MPRPSYRYRESSSLLACGPIALDGECGWLMSSVTKEHIRCFALCESRPSLKKLLCLIVLLNFPRNSKDDAWRLLGGCYILCAYFSPADKFVVRRN